MSIELTIRKIQYFKHNRDPILVLIKIQLHSGLIWNFFSGIRFLSTGTKFQNIIPFPVKPASKFFNSILFLVIPELEFGSVFGRTLKSGIHFEVCRLEIADYKSQLEMLILFLKYRIRWEELVLQLQQCLAQTFRRLFSREISK